MPPNSTQLLAQKDRQTIRNTIRANRKALTESFQNSAANELLTKLSCHSKIHSANNIALYLTNDGELNLQPFIDWCWQQNKAVYLPVIHPFAKGHLLFIRYSVDSHMTINKYGIKEPKLDVRYILPTQQLDVIFTPLVAFDSSGARIGMGGGYYDRTLARWHQNYSIDKHSKPHPVGIAHDCQQIKRVPAEAWDIPLPEIITPTQTITSGL